MTRLQDHYRETVVPQLMEKFGYRTVMQVPRIEKITLNMGVGEAVGDKKVMDFAVGDMEKIAGQKAIVIKAKKSVAGFKIREGWPVGCKVTLRRDRMVEFLQHSVSERFMSQVHLEMWSLVNEPEEVLDALASAPKWNAEAGKFAAVRKDA